MIDKFKKEFDIVYDYVIALGIGALQAIDTLCYQGPCIGSEFETYNALKMYIAHRFEFGFGSVSANIGAVTFYDENNVIMYRAQNDSFYYDTSVPSYKNAPNTFFLKNIYFSRVSRSVFGDLRFIGYRLTFV